MIHVKGVAKQFDDNWIFKNVSLHVPAGASVALVGPSGGGKSVLLKIIGGLLKPDRGEVRIDNANLGMLFQKNALFDSLTVEENLLFPLWERLKIGGTEATKRAAEMLEAVGLAGNQKLYPDEISGGMQKRLGIARALIVQPQVILYDEPTAGLDPITSRKIADLITELRGKLGSTVLTVTNDMQRAYQIGERVYLLSRGMIIDGGSPEEIQASKDPAIRQFIFGLKEGPLTSGLG